MEDWRRKVTDLHAVLLRESNGSQVVWIGVLLEYDIATQGETQEIVHDRLIQCVVVHIAAMIGLRQTPFDGFEPAPEEYTKFYTEADPASASIVRNTRYSLPNLLQDLPPINIETRVRS